MAGFNLKDYVEVKDRIVEFYNDFPTGSITTHIAHLAKGEIIMEARVYRNPEEFVKGIYTSGFARELEGASNVNKTAHVENCETSAIGRALANLMFGVDANRPSRSEMEKVARQRKEHDAMLDFVMKFGAAIDESVGIKLEGRDEEILIKDYIREQWGDARTQFLVARELAKMVEKHTGEEFTG